MKIIRLPLTELDATVLAVILKASIDMFESKPTLNRDQLIALESLQRIQPFLPKVD